MHIIVLAAGFSTRLYPLTKTKPKGLLPVAGKPLIDYLFSQAVALPDIQGITLVTNALYNTQFEMWLNKDYPDLEVTVINDGAHGPDERLGAIGDLQLALDNVSDHEDVLVLPSDTLVGVQLYDFWQRFMTVHTNLNVVYDIGDKRKIADKLGCVELKGSVIQTFKEKPKTPRSTCVSVPLYAFPAKVLPKVGQYMALQLPTDAPGFFLQWLLKNDNVEAYMIDTFYYDVGTIEAYSEAQKRFS